MAREAFERWPAVKVILISTLPISFWPSHAVRALDTLPPQSCSFLPKPFVVTELEAAVQALMGSGPARAARRDEPRWGRTRLEMLPH
jgi:hypothetical protein